MQQVIILPLDQWTVFMQRFDALEKKVITLESQQDEYVGIPKACELLGIKERALQDLRKNPDSLLVEKREGPKGGKVTISRASINAHNEMKARKRRPRLTRAA